MNPLAARQHHKPSRARAAKDTFETDNGYNVVPISEQALEGCGGNAAGHDGRGFAWERPDIGSEGRSEARPHRGA